MFFRLRRFKINLSFDGCSNRLNYGHPDLSTLNSHSTICQITVKSENAKMHLELQTFGGNSFN